MSFGPNTKPASRISESFDAAASLSASSTAREVSIIAQTRIEAGALMSLRRSATALRSSTVEIFGTKMPSGCALPAMPMSSTHQGVSSALMRIRTSRLPNPLAATALAICSRATALASGATESSRSRMMPSAASVGAFSSARAFDPGMNNRLRRGRVIGILLGWAAPPASIVWAAAQEPCFSAAVSSQAARRKSCSRHPHVVSQRP